MAHSKKDYVFHQELYEEPLQCNVTEEDDSKVRMRLYISHKVANDANKHGLDECRYAVLNEVKRPSVYEGMDEPYYYDPTTRKLYDNDGDEISFEIITDASVSPCVGKATTPLSSSSSHTTSESEQPSQPKLRLLRGLFKHTPDYGAFYSDSGVAYIDNGEFICRYRQNGCIHTNRFTETDVRARFDEESIAKLEKEIANPTKLQKPPAAAAKPIASPKPHLRAKITEIKAYEQDPHKFTVWYGFGDRRNIRMSIVVTSTDGNVDLPVTAGYVWHDNSRKKFRDFWTQRQSVDQKKNSNNSEVHKQANKPVVIDLCGSENDTEEPQKHPAAVATGKPVAPKSSMPIDSQATRLELDILPTGKVWSLLDGSSKKPSEQVQEEDRTPITNLDETPSLERSSQDVDDILPSEEHTGVSAEDRERLIQIMRGTIVSPHESSLDNHSLDVQAMPGILKVNNESVPSPGGSPTTPPQLPDETFDRMFGNAAKAADEGHLGMREMLNNAAHAIGISPIYSTCIQEFDCGTPTPARQLPRQEVGVVPLPRCKLALQEELRYLDLRQRALSSRQTRVIQMLAKLQARQWKRLHNRIRKLRKQTKRKLAATKILAFLYGRRDRELCQQKAAELAATIKIQAIVRMRRACKLRRQKANERKAAELAATKIQALFLGARDRRWRQHLADELEAAELAAARKIQALLRGASDRQLCQQLAAKQKAAELAAATKIQAVARMQMACKLRQELQEVMEEVRAAEEAERAAKEVERAAKEAAHAAKEAAGAAKRKCMHIMNRDPKRWKCQAAKADNEAKRKFGAI